MEEEIWKDLIEFPEDYQVSSLGRVRSKTRSKLRSDGRFQTFNSRLLTFELHKTYCYRVRLCVDNCKYSRSVHRLVAEAFLDNPENKPEVNHKDGNRLNNNITNLEWVTKDENMKHAVDTGLIDNPFGEGSRNFHGTTRAWKDGVCYYTMNGNREIIEAGFCYKLVSACILGKQKSHKGYTFTRGETYDSTN